MSRRVNLLLDLEILGWMLVGLAGVQVVPGIHAAVVGDPLGPWAMSALTAVVFGLPVALSTRGEDRRMRTRDAFLVVSGAWVLASLFGALPYLHFGALGPIDAFFEAASGFTTTGASVIPDVEILPPSLLLWRSLTQWIGGGGIVVFAVAVLPLLGIGGMQLFRAEVSGPVTDKLTPRVADTARRLWLVYVGLTVSAGLGLWLAGMGPFDAVCHALTTVATGGFSTRNASLGAFGPAVQWVDTAFMALAGVSFVLHYRCLTGATRGVLRNPELRCYVGLLAVLTLVTAWDLFASHGREAWRLAAFQVVSLVTTTGYASSDFDTWPELARMLVLPMLLVGGMAGSTAGGIKSVRLVLAWRAFLASLVRFVHPHAVHPVRWEGRAVPDDVVDGVGIFLIAYVILCAACAFAVAAAGYDLETALSAAASAVSNVGPGLAEVGPTRTFAHFPGEVKLLLGGAMIAGRLEIFTVLVLFAPRFWRR